MAAIDSLYNLRSQDLNLLNKANIILVPKKDGVESIRDFRPISLIHGVAKIITKVLALRLAPLINNLISPCQSAFIKRRSIHANFLYARNLTRRFHRTKTLALLLKLDISKAFDSVRWDYLISLMQRSGFPLRWRNWITALLTTSTSRVLLNGIPLDPIRHGRGLKQGNPVSPLLFILAIDPAASTFTNNH
jgi:retron-type reverse transcriptase